jgi:hypothetical protein
MADLFTVVAQLRFDLLTDGLRVIGAMEESKKGS